MVSRRPVSSTHVDAPTRQPASLRRATKLQFGVLLLAMVLPTVVTWIYFILLADAPSAWQQLAAGIGKAFQFALPVIWIVAIDPQRLRRVVFSTAGLATGIGFGAAVVLAMFALYELWLLPAGWFDQATKQILAKVQEIGISSRPAFAALGVFYALIHSGLEEYYWRWFVFGQLKPRTGLPIAVLCSSLAFMAHHVIVLGTFFGFHSPLTYLFSVGVAIGGAVWAWLYHHHQRIFAIWVSHMIVDAGIFALGYVIVFARNL